MNSDTERLRQYVEGRSESAFTHLVQEHVNLVYSAALRETDRDAALAEDLTQAVFTALAREAPRLLRHPSLAGWLYTAVRHRAANSRRAERHRQRREQEAQSMNELLSEDSSLAAWQCLRPVLDDALHELKEGDRAALVLRFLEERSLGEVGQRLGLTENAARMRVERALEKLRGLLARRGITSTASGLAAAMAVGVITRAPPALAGTISGAALAGGAVTGSTFLTLKGLMSISAFKDGLAGLVILAGLAVPAWQQTRLGRLRAENAQLRAQVEQSQAQGELAASGGHAQAAGGAGGDPAELQRLREWKAQVQPELLRLRGMAGVARRANMEAEELRGQLAKRAKEAAAGQGSGPMDELRQKTIKQVMEQRTEAQLARMRATLHLTPEQVEAARAILTRQADLMSAGMQLGMSGHFDMDKVTSLAKDAGDPDEQIKALLTPEQKANYPAYKQEEAAVTARQAASGDLMGLQNLNLTPEQEDRAFAALYDFDLNLMNGQAKPDVQAGSTNPADMLRMTADLLQWSSEQKAKALESVLTPAQMDSYRQQQAQQMQAISAAYGKMGASASPNK
jgi:RNA polymerase sigma factor (sigma-70 family)